MNKVIKNNSGSFFVEGSGFTGTATTATRLTLDQAQAKVASFASLGVTGLQIENELVVNASLIQNADGSAWACFYVRTKDLNSDGSVKTNKRNPSVRRFRTKAEAQHHATRMVAHFGHVGYYVQNLTSPVNAWINAATGLTNPEIGKKRLNLQAKS